MKVTKKPKRVRVTYKEMIRVYVRAHYECPACHGRFESESPASDVIRFRCACGQELITDN